MRRWLVAFVALAACTAGAAEVSVIDDAGRTVALPAPARRIVSVAPHLTELLFSAGAGASVVGAVEYSDHPEGAKAIPRIGDSALLDLERVVALQPDLIVVWRDGNAPQQLQRLATLGVPIYASQTHRLAGIATTLRRLGTLAGTREIADAQAARFDDALLALRERNAGRTPLRVFYQIWHRPLLTVNGRHLISEALELCGASNVFASLDALTPAVSEEAVIAQDPDAIVTGSIEPSGSDNLDGWRRLSALRATKLGNLVVVDPDKLHRQSERIALGVHELCGKLDAVRARGAAR